MTFGTISPALLGQLAISGAVTGCIFALVAVGFNFIFNGAGTINFAQGDFAMVGGFLFFTLTARMSLPVIPAVLLGLAGVALLGVAVQVGVMRLARGKGIIGRDTATLGLALLLVALMAALWGVDPLPVRDFTPGPPVLTGAVTLSRQGLWIVVVTMVVAALLQLFFSRTTIGLSLRAATANPRAARGVGLSVERLAIFSWALGAAIAALAGILVTPSTGVVYSAGFLFTLNGFAAASLGGLGSMAGAILGGLTLGLATSLAAAFVSSGYQEAIPMLVLLLVLIFRPTGVLGTGPSRV